MTDDREVILKVENLRTWCPVKKGTFTSGLHHYLMYGFNENRKVCKNDDTEAIKKRVEDLELKIEEIKKIV